MKNWWSRPFQLQFPSVYSSQFEKVSYLVNINYWKAPIAILFRQMHQWELRLATATTTYSHRNRAQPFCEDLNAQIRQNVWP